MSADTQVNSAPGVNRWLASIALATAVWFAAYSYLPEFASVVIAALQLGRDTRFGEAVHFFFYDTPKVLLLLTGIVFVMGKLKMERFLEDWVQKIQSGQGSPHVGEAMTWVERFAAGRDHVRQIVGKVWPYLLLGIGLGAAIHGYVPEDFMASFMGKDVWWAVPAAVLLGVPMYTNAAGIIPIVEALIGKGAALGTVLAFMMAVIALSARK